MDWLDRMNLALNYIEENLTGEIDLNQVARIACHSLSGLQRVFAIIAQAPLSEYIRRRRLTMAAFELTHTDIRVIDLALKYGYDSPEAFARAFSSLHGAPPSAARSQGVHLKAYPRLSFLLTIKGDEPMDYRIETRDAFAVYGIEGIFTMENGENFRAIPKFWGDAMADGRFEKLVASLPDAAPPIDGLGAVHALCSYRETGGSTFPYMIFAFEKPGCRMEGYTKVIVPAATWAAFRGPRHSQEETPQVLQALIRQVYTDWLPNAPYEQADGFDMELYYGQDHVCWEEYWIRVKSKK